MDPITASAEAWLAALQSAVTARDGLSASRRADRAEAAAACCRFQDAAARALNTASYLNAMSSAAGKESLQVLALLGSGAAMQALDDTGSFAKAVLPVVQVVAQHGLSDSLLLQGELRGTVRVAFEALDELTAATLAVRRSAPPVVVEASTELLSAVSTVFAALPGQRNVLSYTPWTRHPWEERTARWTAALAAAWREVGAFGKQVQPPTKRRRGWRRKASAA